MQEKVKTGDGDGGRVIVDELRIEVEREDRMGGDQGEGNAIN